MRVKEPAVLSFVRAPPGVAITTSARRISFFVWPESPVPRPGPRTARAIAHSGGQGRPPRGRPQGSALTVARTMAVSSRLGGFSIICAQRHIGGATSCARFSVTPINLSPWCGEAIVTRSAEIRAFCASETPPRGQCSARVVERGRSPLAADRPVKIMTELLDHRVVKSETHAPSSKATVKATEWRATLGCDYFNLRNQ